MDHTSTVDSGVIQMGYELIQQCVIIEIFFLLSIFLQSVGKYQHDKIPYKLFTAASRIMRFVSLRLV